MWQTSHTSAELIDASSDDDEQGHQFGVGERILNSCGPLDIPAIDKCQKTYIKTLVSIRLIKCKSDYQTRYRCKLQQGDEWIQSVDHTRGKQVSECIRRMSMLRSPDKEKRKMRNTIIMSGHKAQSEGKLTWEHGRTIMHSTHSLMKAKKGPNVSMM